MVKHAREQVLWPSGRKAWHYDSLEEMATEYVQQWDALLTDVVIDGTSHMKQALEALIDGIGHDELQFTIGTALQTGRLYGSNPQRKAQWKGLQNQLPKPESGQEHGSDSVAAV